MCKMYITPTCKSLFAEVLEFYRSHIGLHGQAYKNQGFLGKIPKMHLSFLTIYVFTNNRALVLWSSATQKITYDHL